MDEYLIDQVTEQVLQRLQDAAPTALLIGDRPPDTLGYHLTDVPPYDAILIGSMTSAELLCFCDGRVIDALLCGKPVFLFEGGLRYRSFASTANRPLWSQLLAAERRIRQWGIQFYGSAPIRRLITAGQARQLLAQGIHPPAGAVLTPMARDILEGGIRS